jgi:hypothetical protein
MLSRISGEINTLQRERHESYHRTSATLRDIQAEITSFCDDVTRVLRENKRSLALFKLEIGQINQSVSNIEAHLKTAIFPSDAESKRGDGLVLDRNEGFTTLRELLYRQSREIKGLRDLAAQQVRDFPSSIWTPEAAERIHSVLALLTPVFVEGVPKVRIGRDLDGGYVMLDDLREIAAAISLGISDDVSWDIDIAKRAIRVLQFDPMVPAPPQSHELFEFEPLWIVPRDQPGGISLNTIVQTRLAAVDGALLLKIDIEGSEWDVILATDADVLRRFKQIVVEFHDLDQLGEEQFGSRARDVFTKMASTHLVTHIHGNNCANFANVGNIMVPQSLEVSFAARSSYEASTNSDLFPTLLDRPNQPGRADLYLGQFRFDPRPKATEA